MIQGRDPRQLGDFPTIEMAQFRQGRQQDGLRPDAHALDAFQQLALFGKMLLQVSVDVLVEFADLPVQPFDDGLDAAPDGLGRTCQTMLFGPLDFDQLGTTRHLGQQGFLLFRGQTHEQTFPLVGVVEIVCLCRETAGVDGVRLGQIARRFAEATCLPGVDDHDGYSCGTQGNGCVVFQTTGGFHHDGAQIGEGFQVMNQGLDALRVVAESLCGTDAPQGKLQGLLADINAREVQAGFLRCVHGVRAFE